ncbi:MAG: HAMP domain-containing histidine kinase [Bdellovibrionales bacterium]|nr:HAMP domain-containing histidine kinase [Bdellovibrionales bacterium]
MLDARNLKRWVHDLQSPIGALAAVADRLEKTGGGEAVVLKAAVERLRALSDDLEVTENWKATTVTAAPSGGQANILTAIAPVIVEWRARLAERKEVELAFVCDLPSDLVVPMSMVQLQCSLSNLISNAVEAIQGRGLGVGTVVVRLSQQEKQLVIEVNDNGPGIPQAMLPFVTLYGFTASKANGKGIGLWQVREAARGAGGRLKIESAGDQGTRVALEIPLGESAFAK